MTKKLFLASYSISLFLLGFISCKSHQSKVIDDIVERGELVVTLANDVPGYFRFDQDYYGYQYDLFKAYAEDLGVELQFNVESSDAACRRMLNRGRTDIVVTTANDAMGYQKSLGIFNTNYVVLATKNRRSPHSSEKIFQQIISGQEVDGEVKILISSGFKNTRAYEDLLGSSADLGLFVSARSSFELIDELSRGSYAYVICEKSEAQLGCALVRNVKQVYEFDEKIQMYITTNEANAAFFEDFSRWFADFRTGDEYAMLNDLYFEKGIVGQLIGNNESRTAGSISAYDDIMRNVSQQEGGSMDWRLLSAIAYHESRFNRNAVSVRGARGIMQIMPIVARQFNIPESDVMNPEINIMLAAKLLVKIERVLKIPANTPFEDKMKLLLACYNGGLGHVIDARNLADKYGKNQNSWHDVSEYLELKREVQYHQDSIVKHGRFSGSKETLSFVDKVMWRYDKYCIIAKR